MMRMGSMKFKQRGREEQAEADGMEVSVLTHPHITHAHVLWDLNAPMLYEDCDVVSLGEWCRTFAEMVAQVRTQKCLVGTW